MRVTQGGINADSGELTLGESTPQMRYTPHTDYSQELPKAGIAFAWVELYPRSRKRNQEILDRHGVAGCQCHAVFRGHWTAMRVNGTRVDTGVTRTCAQSIMKDSRLSDPIYMKF